MVLAQFTRLRIQRIDQGTVGVQAIRGKQVDHDRRAKRGRLADRQCGRPGHLEKGVVRRAGNIATRRQHQRQEERENRFHGASSSSLSGSGERSNWPGLRRISRLNSSRLRVADSR